MDAPSTTQKHNIATIADKNRIIDNIIATIASREHFLVIGHRSPDEDCVSSLVGISLILSKFGRNPVIYLGTALSHQYQYLLNICKYNSITIVNSFSRADFPVDAMFIVDTPKPSMLDTNPEIEALILDPAVRKIEIDHHIGADGAYSGDKGYRLVTAASSAAELVGHLALKLNGKPRVLKQFQINELFSRNLVLSLLTGIIADSNMGAFLKSRREQRYYAIFSSMFNTMLARDTTKDSNFADMKQIYSEINTLSTKEEQCYSFIMKREHRSRSIAYVVLTREDTRKLYREFDADTIVAVTRSVADKLAEESGKLGLVAYYDNPALSELVQFRVRRSQSYKSYDLRQILTRLAIENGGGHEGAIGFRFPSSEISNIGNYVRKLVGSIETALDEAQAAARP